MIEFYILAGIGLLIVLCAAILGLIQIEILRRTAEIEMHISILANMLWEMQGDDDDPDDGEVVPFWPRKDEAA